MLVRKLVPAVRAAAAHSQGGGPLTGQDGEAPHLLTRGVRVGVGSAHMCLTSCDSGEEFGVMSAYIVTDRQLNRRCQGLLEGTIFREVCVRRSIAARL